MEAIAHPAIPDELCTLQTCSLLQAHFRYLPSLFGNALFLAIFAVLVVPQVALGIKYKTWGFMVAMLGGLILEVIGYTARVQMHSNPFSQDPFLMYIVTLTIGPAFFAAAIYLCLGRIVMVFGEQISRFRPRTYTITFISFDFFSLILQAAGGALASAADTQSSLQIGVDVMLAGLGTQVVSLSLFIALCGEFAWRVSHNKHDLEPAYAELRASKVWKFFLIGLGISTITIFIRSCFRVAELSQGFQGKLANQQVTFMILEGAMIVIASIALTIPHPGVAFKGTWAAANFHLRGRKSSAREMESGKVTPPQKYEGASGGT
ncbi:MAG: hypothetical protein M1830_005130 [Pleopsidium flavum]|nr:MAG: hypothetical protein M1830_005130 [Pleopsidium flavum]